MDVKNVPTPIENLTARDIRREITTGFQTILGNRTEGFEVDGILATGYGRTFQVNGLDCSHVRFSRETTVSPDLSSSTPVARIDLLGLLDNQEEFQEFERQTIGKTATSDHNYRTYLIPEDEDLPVMVVNSTFMAHQLQENPKFSSWLWSDKDVSQAEAETPQIIKREATEQDLRDALCIYRAKAGMVRRAIASGLETELPER